MQAGKQSSDCGIIINVLFVAEYKQADDGIVQNSRQGVDDKIPVRDIQN